MHALPQKPLDCLREAKEQMRAAACSIDDIDLDLAANRMIEAVDALSEAATLLGIELPSTASTEPGDTAASDPSTDQQSPSISQSGSGPNDPGVTNEITSLPVDIDPDEELTDATMRELLDHVIDLEQAQEARRRRRMASIPLLPIERDW